MASSYKAATVSVRGPVPIGRWMDSLRVSVGDALRKTYMPCILDGLPFYNGSSVTSHGHENYQGTGYHLTWVWYLFINRCSLWFDLLQGVNINWTQIFISSKPYHTRPQLPNYNIQIYLEFPLNLNISMLRTNIA